MDQACAAIKRHFADLHCPAEHWSLRYVRQDDRQLWVRKQIAEPPRFSRDQGAMLVARVAGVDAYAATSDLSRQGLQAALERACELARRIAPYALFDQRALEPSSARGDYRSPGFAQPFPGLAECYQLLAEESATVPADPRLVNWRVGLHIREVEQLYLNNSGAELSSAQRYLYPHLAVTAYDGHDSQTRQLGGGHLGQQGGAELIERLGLIGAAPRVAEQALQLLLAPNTPTGRRDLLLLPDQLILQLHESIGHPLELDRILGDERNFAGSSFVRLEDFGQLQYGSALLNVSFDPTLPEELASYAYDDQGTAARKTLLIRHGRLLRPLGGALSQQRSGLPGVACSRASSWNRPPIDRMANLNIEPGNQSLTQLIGAIERGILMASNRSWSIDDRRDKFQFGCEWGQLIENGELRGVVKNPNYRGRSLPFWHSLKAVGDASTRQVLGTAYCGKGEPNQALAVGHATPACVFAAADVFGGVD